MEPYAYLQRPSELPRLLRIVRRGGRQFTLRWRSFQYGARPSIQAARSDQGCVYQGAVLGIEHGDDVA
ncbi:MAG: hypothetical protein WBA29_08065 [Xanthobacteraceae bacterium]